ncbi:hypothetical protein HDU85_001519 [Gaertneriomyces sp. JEL0708]|nr:hypothetical protein HDU85_001519 [Gaertneriomyces sp. JEL0708]
MASPARLSRHARGFTSHQKDELVHPNRKGRSGRETETIASPGRFRQPQTFKLEQTFVHSEIIFETRFLKSICCPQEVKMIRNANGDISMPNVLVEDMLHSTGACKAQTMMSTPEADRVDVDESSLLTRPILTD